MDRKVTQFPLAGVVGSNRGPTKDMVVGLVVDLLTGTSVSFFFALRSWNGTEERRRASMSMNESELSTSMVVMIGWIVSDVYPRGERRERAENN